MKNHILKNLIRLICSLFAFSVIVSCGNNGTSAPEWTVMLYMAADNNLDPVVPLDLEELRTATINSRVNVIVQVDTRSSTTKRYRIANGTLELLTDLGEQDMSSPDVLRDFLVTATRNFPAPKTALILWSHGNGWQSGVDKRVYAVTEDLSGRGARYPMSNAVLARALTDARQLTGQKIDILGFDACIMATLEAAFEFRSSASYLVASQDLVQGNGWDYKDLMTRLSANPEIEGEEFAKLMVRSYADYAESPRYGFGDQALSVVRLGAAVEVLALEVDSLSKRLLADMGEPLTRQSAVTNIQAARAAVQEFDQSAYPGMYVDLLDLSTRLNASPAFAQALSNAVVLEYHGKERPAASGLSIVFIDRARVSSYSSRYYYDDYKNYDPITGVGSISSFIVLYNWDEMMLSFFTYS